MSQAFDLGVTHFDVARSYGFGRAEEVVGKFIRSRRDRVTVATKFGIVPPSLGAGKMLLMPVARFARRVLPALQTQVRRESGKLLASHRFDVGFAKRCLSESLKSLDTDYLDIYLVHEPDDSGDIAEDLRNFMEMNVRDGVIRRWGLAHGGGESYLVTPSLSGDIVQMECGAADDRTFDGRAEDQRQRIGTRPLAASNVERQRLVGLLKTPAMIKSIAGIGAKREDVLLCASLAWAGPHGSILCSMFSSEHIQSNLRSISEFANHAGMNELLQNLHQACCEQHKQLDVQT